MPALNIIPMYSIESRDVLPFDCCVPCRGNAIICALRRFTRKFCSIHTSSRNVISSKGLIQLVPFHLESPFSILVGRKIHQKHQLESVVSLPPLIAVGTYPLQEIFIVFRNAPTKGRAFPTGDEDIGRGRGVVTSPLCFCVSV